MPKLDNWSVIIRDASPYQAPELATQAIHGIISGDERVDEMNGTKLFPDGCPITTSALKAVVLEGEQLTVVTNSGTTYELGEVAPEYEKLYPNAKARFINSWFKVPA